MSSRRHQVSRASSVFLAALCATLLGCGAAPTPDPLLEDVLSVTSIFGAELHGRHFIFQRLEAPAPNGQLDFFLQAEGDDTVVSMHASQPPFVPVVIGETVHFGGHGFTVTTVPNRFLVDGQPHVLPPHRLHSFSDGVFVGTHVR